MFRSLGGRWRAVAAAIKRKSNLSVSTVRAARLLTALGLAALLLAASPAAAQILCGVRHLIASPSRSTNPAQSISLARSLRWSWVRRTSLMPYQ